MKAKKGCKKKRDTQLIIVVAIILALVIMNASYSAFFTVQSLSTIEEIEMGKLNVEVTVDNQNSITTSTSDSQIVPKEESEIKDGDGYYSTLTLTNKGDLDAEYSVSIGYDYDTLKSVIGDDKTDEELLDDLVSFSYLHIGIYDTTNGNWENFGEKSEVEYPIIANFTSSSDGSNVYPVLRDSLDVEATKSYKIYVWLDENTPTSEIGKYVYLKLTVKCAAGSETIKEEVAV